MYAYRLRKTGSNSEKLGNCEVCKKPSDSVFILTQMRRHKHGVTYHGCGQWFGHKACLAALTGASTR